MNKPAAITSLGTTTAYVELLASSANGMVTLAALGIEYCPRTGLNRETPIDTLTVESEMAEDAGSDLQGLAKEWLDSKRKDYGWFWNGLSFDKAAFNFVYA
jgi:uncharacterized protein YfiM (DUF2279 family)